MPEPTTAPQSPPPAGPSERTRLGPKWLAKTLIFMLILVAFGCWGLYDATTVYPERGINYAENAKWMYLRAARDAGSLFTSSIADPVAAYARLSDSETLKANQAAASDPKNPKQPQAQVEFLQYQWLNGLDTIGRLTPEFTKIEQPEKTLQELEAKWKGLTQPKPLAKWDLPVQWLFVVVGLGGGLTLAALVVKVKSRTYGWEPAEQRLFLPDRSSLVPADIAEFDKRKWDKFLIFLKVRPGHQRHGGKEIKLDLLRYIPLEEWVLAMERTAFPENSPPPAAQEPPGATSEQAAVAT